jgi:hypothetical protein
VEIGLNGGITAGTFKLSTGSFKATRRSFKLSRRRRATLPA